MKQAGIARKDVGALFTGRTPQAYMVLQYNQALLNELKIGPTFNSESHTARRRCTRNAAARRRRAPCRRDRLRACASPTRRADCGWIRSGSNAGWEGDLQFEAPYGATTPALYAQFACRYMHEYGVTPEMCARVAVENRRWALDHPHAAMRHKGPITIEDVLNSRMIASPLRCSTARCGTRAELRQRWCSTRADLADDRHEAPTWIAGFGQCTTHEWVGERMGGWGYAPLEDGPDLIRTGASVAAQQAYEMSGLTPKDIDIVQTSAPFTFANLMMLEELGFCARGEGGEFVASGGIDYDGGLPFNTMGGYLSFGQVAQGLYNLHETSISSGAAPKAARWRTRRSDWCMATAVRWRRIPS